MMWLGHMWNAVHVEKCMGHHELGESLKVKRVRFPVVHQNDTTLLENNGENCFLTVWNDYHIILRDLAQDVKQRVFLHVNIHTNDAFRDRCVANRSTIFLAPPDHQSVPRFPLR